MFRLRKLKVFPGCTGIKNLKDKEYTFISDDCQKFPAGIYGNNIIVSAIVGKNGSGKSSVLDIVYRVLNNVNALLCSNLNTKEYIAFGYVLGVRAEIEFSSENIPQGKIKCYDNTLWMDIDDCNGNQRKIYFGDKQENHDDYQHVQNLTEVERVKILSHLFYCSVVNYAPFTLNAHDYDNETCIVADKNFVHGKLNLNRHNWIQAIFHKNDGYMSNITLTPYRNYGEFNSDKEARLSKERILSILAIHPDFIEGYRLKQAYFTFNKSRFIDKFGLTHPTRHNAYKPKMEIEELVQLFENILDNYKYNNTDSVAARILRCLGYHQKDIILDSVAHIYSYLYLVYKVLNCAQYPAFSEYSDLNLPDLAVSDGQNHKLLDRVTNLTKAVQTEHSHITFKIERVRNYLSVLSKIKNPNKFTLEEYFTAIQGIEKDGNIIPMARKLPPSFFDCEISLYEDDREQSEIQLEKLSSGERLFYVTISSIIYHAMNLISIPGHDWRVKYKNMLVILDETELCFHPDYQRTFIHKLLLTIKRLRFNEVMGFHILMTTHSPFILSDIPTTNILYLNGGRAVNAVQAGFINPFCANINDILCQSFFLSKDGFIGERARKIVMSLFRFLSEDNDSVGENIDDCELLTWTKENSQFTIANIGEPLIKNTLQTLYNRKFRDIDAIRRQIAQLQQELKMIEEN